MPISMDALMLGEAYTRPQLAEMWGYKSHQAIDRGIFVPANDNKIILFVTKEKQSSFPQYADYFEGDVLHMEGEEGHQNDLRLANAGARGEMIYLFYRERHHTPFMYYGPVRLLTHTLRADAPSEFRFSTSRAEQGEL